ncbi:hypothetical protein [Halobacteriovorax sp. HLS]|uniref:hypothetical protein n=1 Tax=Halobacteriovorax sp. HLS TaxID=2234000 RepID=UPI000FD6DEFA|nr:hypothetical protein [Halobacteriovorax sp. HLS]
MNNKIPKKIHSFVVDDDSLLFYADIAIYQRYALYVIIFIEIFIMIQMKLSGFLNSFSELIYSLLGSLAFILIILFFAHILNNTKSYRYLVINRDSIYFQKYSKFFGVGKRIKLDKKNITEVSIVFNDTEISTQTIRNSYLSIVDKKYNRYEIDLTFSSSTSIVAHLPMDLVRAPVVLLRKKISPKNIKDDFSFAEMLLLHLRNLGYSGQIFNNSSTNNSDSVENFTFEE